MKKAVNVLVGIILGISMTVTAMAAEYRQSPKPGVTLEGKGDIVLEDGTVVEIDDPEEMDRYVKVEETKTEPEKKPPVVQNYSAVTLCDVKLSGGVSSASVVLHVPGVKKGDTVLVRMYIDGKWVNLECEVIGDNQVRVTVKGSGTVEILKKNSGSEKPGTGNSGSSGGGSGGHSRPDSGNGGGNTSATSPKTGETSALPMAYAAFAVLAAIAAAAGYKAKKMTE